MATPTDEPLLTMPTAARRLGRSAEWVKARCDGGQLACWLVNGRRYTTEAAVTDYLERCRLTPTARPVPPAARTDRAYAAAVANLKRMGV